MTAAAKPARKRPASTSSLASGAGKAGDQVATASQAAAAAVPAARQARVVDPTAVTGTLAEQLAVYEAAIDAAHETARSTLAAAKARYVVEAGTALREIRDRGLYKLTHADLESYCEERHGITRARIYQIIDAAPVMIAMSKFLDTPLVESHARVLEPVMRAHGVDAARELVARVQDAGKVTAAALKQARRDAGYEPAAPESAALRESTGGGKKTAVERLGAAQERLSRVSGSVTRATVRAASREHPGHTARLVADLTADVTSIAAALGLTVSKDGRPG
ncbi:hypothetical protein [Streptomyces sp. SID3343]|uniref:hypothetical protein n=1 Tax=Streptomyces sp. SID3343 TaxID=2690260 RepID=UPI00136BAFB2|nr:hypothetical protein [Streptomyces sp. SID3343]MYW04084.1 hypothetical protein [Streptomyces sp. SID3343]